MINNKFIMFQQKPELRAEQMGENDQVKRIIRGYPILFDSPAKIRTSSGEWTEYVRQGALDGVDLSELILLGHHDTNNPLAKVGVNMRAEIDKTKGLFIEAELPNTRNADDMYELVSREIVNGMSYWFNASDVRNDPATKTSEILKFEWIREVSIVTFPAYPETLAIAFEKRSGDWPPQTQDKRKLLF